MSAVRTAPSPAHYETPIEFVQSWYLFAEGEEPLPPSKGALADELCREFSQEVVNKFQAYFRRTGPGPRYNNPIVYIYQSAPHESKADTETMRMANWFIHPKSRAGGLRVMDTSRVHVAPELGTDRFNELNVNIGYIRPYCYYRNWSSGMTMEQFLSIAADLPDGPRQAVALGGMMCAHMGMFRRGWPTHGMKARWATFLREYETPLERLRRTMVSA